MVSSSSNTAIAIFCRDLREARRYQQVSLQEVASTTRISIEYIESLEAGRWDEVPVAYRRGYLGLYAQAIGMNRDKVLKSYDLLIEPHSSNDRAVLDEAPRILSEPQHAELTRAKIRSAWFVSLSRHRSAVYSLTFIVILLLLGLIHLSRRSQKIPVAPLQFNTAMAESRSKVHSPLTVVSLYPDSTIALKNQWVNCVGLRIGTIGIVQDTLEMKFFRFNAFDTIKIEYESELTMRIQPSQSALCMKGDSLLSVTENLRGDTALYKLRKSVQLDNTYPNLKTE